MGTLTNAKTIKLVGAVVVSGYFLEVRRPEAGSQTEGPADEAMGAVQRNGSPSRGPSVQGRIPPPCARGPGEAAAAVEEDPAEGLADAHHAARVGCERLHVRRL